MATVTTTGGVTMGAAGVASVILWGYSGFPAPMPDGVALVLAGAVLTVAHALAVFATAVARRWGLVLQPNDQPPPAQAAPAAPAPAAPGQ